jgi:uncharacterized protein YqgC (DUF456 family)
MLRKTAGMGLLIVGVAGLVLPVIPGIPLIAAGVALLGADHPVVRKGIDWLERKGWKVRK